MQTTFQLVVSSKENMWPKSDIRLAFSIVPFWAHGYRWQLSSQPPCLPTLDLPSPPPLALVPANTKLRMSTKRLISAQKWTISRPKNRRPGEIWKKKKKKRYLACVFFLFTVFNLYSKSEHELQGSGISVTLPKRSRTVSRRPNPSAVGHQQRSDIKNTKDEEMRMMRRMRRRMPRMTKQTMTITTTGARTTTRTTTPTRTRTTRTTTTTTTRLTSTRPTSTKTRTRTRKMRTMMRTRTMTMMRTRPQPPLLFPSLSTLQQGPPCSQHQHSPPCCSPRSRCHSRGPPCSQHQHSSPCFSPHSQHHGRAPHCSLYHHCC